MRAVSPGGPETVGATFLIYLLFKYIYFDTSKS
jgi:hypothetical protein